MESYELMKISINSIKGLNKRYKCADDIAPDGVQALYEKIGAQLGGIEEVIDIGTRYQGVVIVRIVSIDKHPNADTLNICKVDDGAVIQGLDRDKDGHVQVVCGAPNLYVGMTVAWLPPGSTVPESVGKEPLLLGSRELRGVVSDGMLASARELGIGDNHKGIMALADGIQPGTAFDEHYELQSDVVYDIENKMFTHRPDCFGFLGVSREIAGIQGMLFKSPAWYMLDAIIPEIEAELLPLEVRNELPELVRRFCAVAMSNVTVGPSPDWLQIELAKVGQRPINNIVDYTNFFMLETGQPLHAYDYDKVKALDGGDKATLVIRNPRPGEKITLLNGKEIEPRAGAIMIATDTSLLGVGGVMGGQDTEVDEHTSNIILEAANFDMYSIRRTSMAHGLFTDAVTRFNKGQSPLQNRAVLAKIVDEIRKFAGGRVASQLVDDNHLPDEVLTRGSIHPPVTVADEFINARLGTALDAEAMRALLTNVEFAVEVSGNSLTVKAPFWRTDIEIPEDIVEEVGRLYGYDKLPLVLPRRSILPAKKDATMSLKASIRNQLSKAGANELLTYSFVHGKLLQKAGQDPDQAFKLSNALSPDLEYYRLSVTPSLLDKVHANIKSGHDEFALFEIGKAHAKSEFDVDGIPAEFNRIALVFAANAKAAAKYQGAPYYQAARYLYQVFDAYGIVDIKLVPAANDIARARLEGHEMTKQMLAPFDADRSAVLLYGERVVGVVGEYTGATRLALKLPECSAGFEIFHGFLSQSIPGGYTPVSRYPRVEQDICFKVDTSLEYQQLLDFVSARIAHEAPDDTYSTLSPVDIYQRPDDTAHKQITVRLSIASNDKTLRDTEVTALIDTVATAALQELGAQRV